MAIHYASVQLLALFLTVLSGLQWFISIESLKTKMEVKSGLQVASYLI